MKINDIFKRLFFAKTVNWNDIEANRLIMVIDPKTSVKYLEYEGRRVKLYAVED